MKKLKTPDFEKYLEGKKRRFVNYTQGAKIYRMYDGEASIKIYYIFRKEADEVFSGELQC